MTAKVFLYGTHAVLGALKNPARHINQVWMTQNVLDHLDPQDVHLLPKGYKIVKTHEIESKVPKDAVHQGILLETSPLPVIDLHTFLEEAPTVCNVVLLDQVTDPQNLGTILRSAAAFNVHAVITTDRHSPPINGALAKTASGALELVPLIHVTNLAQSLNLLKKYGFWCYGLDERGEDMGSITFPDRTAFIMGAEGKGLRHLTIQTCDVLMRIPTVDSFSTLNVSVSTGIALYALTASRRGV